jgi:hypothetical protein
MGRSLEGIQPLRRSALSFLGMGMFAGWLVVVPHRARLMTFPEKLTVPGGHARPDFADYATSRTRTQAASRSDHSTLQKSLCFLRRLHARKPKAFARWIRTSSKQRRRQRTAAA